MTFVIIGTIIILILILVVIGIIYYAYRRITTKVQTFSTKYFHTPDLMQAIQNAPQDASDYTPKSVSAATSIYLPNIVKEFPDFHYEEMKRRAENVLTSYLRSVDEMDASRLTEGTSELVNKLKLQLDMLRDAGQSEHYQDIKIHRTEICTYRKTKGRCSIIFQSSVQYNYWAMKGAQITEGGKNILRQDRYNVELIYIQDRDVVENIPDSGMAMNCPNCGAPLPKLGAKKCAYCDSPVVEFNIRTWNFSDVQKM
ncbi:MAG: hypothetical protein J1E03_07895 [Acetatifactor sp.]|nr:hypothetical protein [Acetatifactor sp.]